VRLAFEAFEQTLDKERKELPERPPESDTDEGEKDANLSAHRVVDILQLMCELYGLWCIERNLAFFLEEGYVSASKSIALRKRVDRCCDALVPDLLSLVDGFGIPDLSEANPNVPPIVRGLASYRTDGPEWKSGL